MTPAQPSKGDDADRPGTVKVLAAGAVSVPEERLLRELSDQDWQVRRAAADALVQRGGSAVIGLLLRAAKESHHELAFLNSAIRVLAESGSDVVDQLADFLVDPDPQLRMAAALTLGERGDSRAVPRLLQSLDDNDTNVRFHVIEALGKLRAREAVDRLVALAESRDFSLTIAALDALGAIGESRIASRLTPLLHDHLFQSAALDALARLGSAEILPELAGLLNSPTAPVVDVSRALVTLHDRVQAMYGQGRVIADQTAGALTDAGVERLLAAASELPAAQLKEVAVLLGWINDQRALPALVHLLKFEPARSPAIEALVGKGGGATELLIEQLEADDFEMRQAVVAALGQIGDTRSVPALIKLIATDGDLVVAAVEALGMIRDAGAQNALVGLLGHADTFVRQAAISALGTMTPVILETDVERLLANENPLVRESAAIIAGSARYRSCSDRLLECCHDEHESVRGAAFRALGYLNDSRLIPILADALQTAQSPTRTAAVRALEHMDLALARPLLVPALGDPDPWVRYFAVRAAGRHQLAEILPTLLPLAEFDDAMPVRIAAVDAIGELGAAITTVLVRLSQGPQTDLSQAAARALRAVVPGALPDEIAKMPSREERR